MKWNSYTIDTTVAAEDIVAAELYALGIEGVEIENKVPLTDEEIGDMFIDFPAELGEDDGKSRVTFYLDSEMDDAEKKKLLADVSRMLDGLKETMDIGSATITGDITEDIDWINNWKSFFTSFRIGDILIKPGWEDAKDLKNDDGTPFAPKTVIEIDPGISFGTGKHETTYMCIESLDKYVKSGDEVLDLGCGSGILSVAAIKLGAGHVVGTDIDENCMTSSVENVEKNGIDPSKTRFIKGNLITDETLERELGEGCYDIVVANILADVIIPMAPKILPRLKKSGKLITSGIIDTRESDVRKALEDAGFDITEINHMGEWVNINAVPRG